MRRTATWAIHLEAIKEIIIIPIYRQFMDFTNNGLRCMFGHTKELERCFRVPQSLNALFHANLSFVRETSFKFALYKWGIQRVVCRWSEPLFCGTGVFPQGFPVFCSRLRMVCMALISSVVISLNCLVVDSLALQILMHFSTVNLGSACMFSCTVAWDT